MKLTNKDMARIFNVEAQKQIELARMWYDAGAMRSGDQCMDQSATLIKLSSEYAKKLALEEVEI